MTTKLTLFFICVASLLCTRYIVQGKYTLIFPSSIGLTPICNYIPIFFSQKKNIPRRIYLPQEKYMGESSPLARKKRAAQYSCAMIYIISCNNPSISKLFVHIAIDPSLFFGHSSFGLSQYNSKPFPSGSSK